jgi:hypothetical protein
MPTLPRLDLQTKKIGAESLFTLAKDQYRRSLGSDKLPLAAQFMNHLTFVLQVGIKCKDELSDILFTL